MKIESKIELFKTLKEFDQLNKYSLSSKDFTLKTYQLIFKDAVIQKENSEFLQLKSDNKENDIAWIFKSDFGLAGKGITLYPNLQKSQEFFRQQINPKINRKKENFQIQEYLQYPDLIRGQKFNIRCYIYFAWNEEGSTLIYFGEGQIRMTTEQYNPEISEDQKVNQMRHLTHQSTQIKNKNYDKNNDFYDGNSYTFAQFKQYFKTQYNFNDQQVLGVMNDMYKTVSYIAEAVTYKTKKVPGQYMIAGLDFLMKNQKLVFLETNVIPLFDVQQYSSMIQTNDMIRDVMSMQTHFFDLRTEGKSISEEIKKPEYQNWGKLTLLINEAIGYNINEQNN